MWWAKAALVQERRASSTIHENRDFYPGTMEIPLKKGCTNGLRNLLFQVLLFFALFRPYFLNLPSIFLFSHTSPILRLQGCKRGVRLLFDLHGMGHAGHFNAVVYQGDIELV